MIEPTTKNYPSVTQSFGIVGIIVLGSILLIPVDLILSKIINKEAAKLLYYLFAIGIPFLIVYSIRKRKTGKYSFELGIKINE